MINIMGALSVAGVMRTSTIKATEGIWARMMGMIRKTTLETKWIYRPAHLSGVTKPKAYVTMEGGRKLFLNPDARSGKLDKRGKCLLMESELSQLNGTLRPGGFLLKDVNLINRMTLVGKYLADRFGNKVVCSIRAREELVDEDCTNPLVKIILIS